MRRFFIILGISVFVLLVSGILQLVFQQDKTFGFFSFGGSCEITGYPIALCLSSNNQVKIYVTYIINILFWFWLIDLLWNWFNKSRK